MAINSEIQNKDISYLGKDFNSFKTNLSQLAKTYFPTMHNDFTTASPGTMFIEMAAYVGDVLSFYMDSQLKESMLPYAKERANVVALANTLGYSVKPTKAAVSQLETFIILPADSNGVPAWEYAPTLQQNSEFKSEDSGILFTSDYNVDFAYSSSSDTTDISVYKINTTTNLPSYFLLKKQVEVTSGERKTLTFPMGPAERFKKIEIPDQDVIEIESISDSESNTWHQVPYLAQETIYQEISNTSEVDPHMSSGTGAAPYLLKLKKTSKRFITRTTADNKIEIIFGSGISSSPDEMIVPNTTNVGNNAPGGISKLDRAFDPSNFLQTKTYGQAPSNTILTVKYKAGGGQKANSVAQSITKVATAHWDNVSDGLNSGIYQQVKTSLAVSNPAAAQGGGSAETINEIKQNALAHFQTQNRIVTKEDYIGRAYSMPSRYGNIAKAFVASDSVLDNKKHNAMPDKFELQNPNATNLYLLGYDENKKLTNVNEVVKQNLKTYLTPYRMLTDAINIKNGFIINIGVEFAIIPLGQKNGNEVLLRCIETIKKYFNTENRQFNEPIVISDLQTTIASTIGVQSLQSCEIINKWRSTKGYSGIRYDIKAATKNNIIYPSVDPSIFELKNPSIDIKGRIITY